MEWGNQIESESSQNVTVMPASTVNLRGYDTRLQSLRSANIYTILIENKIRQPWGLLRWGEDLHLSDSQNMKVT